MAAPPLPAPPPPEPSGGIVEPVPVVAPHFCAPYVVQLSVKEKYGLRQGDFTITDTNGAVVIRVEGAFISIHNRRLLLDANGNPLLCMRLKVNHAITCWMENGAIRAFLCSSNTFVDSLDGIGVDNKLIKMGSE